MSNPNASVALTTGGAGTLLVYLLNKYAGTEFTPEAAAGIATGAATVFLFIGRRGIKGTLQMIWSGSDRKKK